MGRYAEASGKIAGRIGKAEPPPAGDDGQPRSNPHACCAFGCPLLGPIVIDGRRFCFVHCAVRDETARWDEITVRLNNRPRYLAAIKLLRAPGMRSDESVIASAQQLLPHIELEPARRYAALAAVEGQLQDECFAKAAPEFAV